MLYFFLLFTSFFQAVAEKPSFVLTSPIYNPGFFSTFNTVIGALDCFDRDVISGLRVDFQQDGWYYDPRFGENWWDYYFEPIALEKGISRNEEQLFPTYQKIIFAYHSQFEMSRERAHELIQKYIRIRPHIQRSVDEFCNRYFSGRYVIGIHYRGTDKLEEAAPVSYETIVQSITEVRKEHPNALLFLATDESRFANFMNELFAGQIIMRNALRSDTTVGVHMCKNLDPYQKGKDAILDCLLLSRCSLLIKTASNLSDCSTQFNPTIPVIKLNRSYSE